MFVFWGLLFFIWWATGIPWGPGATTSYQMGGAAALRGRGDGNEAAGMNSRSKALRSCNARCFGRSFFSDRTGHPSTLDTCFHSRAAPRSYVQPTQSERISTVSTPMLNRAINHGAQAGRNEPVMSDQ